MLGLLTSIERDSADTQRKLARDLGIALVLPPAHVCDLPCERGS